MRGEVDFKAFCVEAYKAECGLSGKQVADAFEKFGVFDYLDEFYDVLHTLGRDRLIEDISKFIAARQ